MRFPFFDRGSTYLFHMRGGHIVATPNVKHFTCRRGPDGSFSGYKIQWAEGCTPEFFSLSIPDIVAITVEY